MGGLYCLDVGAARVAIPIPRVGQALSPMPSNTLQVLDCEARATETALGR